MIQQSQSWAYIWRKPYFEKIHAPQCSLQHCLFTMAKTWKQPKRPLTEEWMMKMRCIYTMGYDSAIRKNETMPFATTWTRSPMLQLGVHFACYTKKKLKKIPHIRDVVQYLSYSVWLTSLSMTLLRSIHVAENWIISFFTGWVVFHWIYVHICFIRSSVSGHSGCFHVLAIVNSPAVNTGVHVSFQILVFSSCMPRSGIAESYSNSTLVFFFKEPPYCSP